MAESDKIAVLKILHQFLQSSQAIKAAQDTRLVLAESIPQQSQRIYRLLNPERLGTRLYRKLEKAEEAIYDDPIDPMVNWNQQDLDHWFQKTEWIAEITVEETSTDTSISKSLIQHWFTPGTDRPSYGDRLSSVLSLSELEKVQHVITKELLNQVVPWRGAIAYIRAKISEAAA